MLPRLSLVMSTLALTLAACGGGGGPGGSTTPVAPAATYTAASGVAQKGALAVGSSVTVRELGLNLAATGGLHTYATTTADGGFAPGDTFASPRLALTATGQYADEVTGAASDGAVTLQAYANLATESTLGVNVLTTLAFTRIDTLVNKNGLAFADAKAQAEREVLAAFGIVVATSPGAFGTLDIGAAAPTDGDTLLAALSSVVAHGRSAAQVGVLLASLQADIGAHGAITDAAALAALALDERSLDLDRVAAHLATQYGKAISADALAQWLDQDGDGVIARDEFRVDGATAASTFALPADLVAARAGAAVTPSAGQLWINGTAAAAGATLHAGDSVLVAAPSTLPDGVLDVYLQAGGASIARVSFVKGLAAIAIAPTTGTLPLGLSQRFTATASFADGSTADVSRAVTWRSGTPAVASIGSASGLADALALGTTTLSASSGGVTGTLSLDAVAAALQSLTIAPATLQTGVGITRRLVATGTFSDGSTGDVSASAAWTAQAAGLVAIGNGAVSGLALGTTGVTATIGGVSASASVTVDTDTWSAAPAMPTERVAGATATLLANGRLLVAGGVKSGGAGSAAVDLFDPVALAWTAVAPMTVQRASHTATLLPDGRVLVVGGSVVSTQASQGDVNDAGAEIYDPVANTWTRTPDMSVARSHHSATLLADGTVLVVGGEDAHYLVNASAELYDPVANAWSAPRTLPVAARSRHTATLLASGQVLIAGGFDIVAGVLTPLATTELYDPVTHVDTATATDGTVTTTITGKDFTAATPMAAPHDGHSATRLPDGRVLVAGGGTTLSELYDPATATWTTQGATGALHAGHAAVLLASGQVLVVGGTQSAQPAAERFDPATGLWSPAGSMQVLRANPVAARLPDGSVLACGGAVDSAGANCESYW